MAEPEKATSDVSSVWEDSMEESAALALRRVVRRRAPTIRRTPFTLPPEELSQEEEIPVHAVKQKAMKEMKEVRAVKSMSEEEALAIMKKALSVKIASQTKGQKSLLLHFSLFAIGFLFLESALLLGFTAERLILLAPARIPLELPVRRDITDQQAQGLLAFLSQSPVVAKVRFVTKEQRAALLEEHYAPHLPFLESYAPGSSLFDSVFLTLDSAVDDQSFLTILLRPAPSSLLDPSFLMRFQEWQGRRDASISFFQRVELFAASGFVLSFLLLTLLFRNVLRIERKERQKEEHLMLLMGAPEATFQRSLLFHGSLLSGAAFLTVTLLLGAAFFFLS